MNRYRVGLVVVMFAGASLGCGATGDEATKTQSSPNASDAGTVRETTSATGSDAGTVREAAASVGCSAVPEIACPEPPVVYANVSATIHDRCAEGCHNGLAGPWPLLEYEHIAAWARDIRADLSNCSMPPEDAGTRLSSEERIAILTWVKCGTPP